MAGNVFEWTNDLKGPHVAKPVTNPIGAQNANNEFERVIKGGSFEHGIFNLRPTCRSATYPTAASSSCEYVGFRCAGQARR
jgi:formylglycine-generating enzyme required for sulfatase activity